jgi:hypothetical protein
MMAGGLEKIAPEVALETLTALTEAPFAVTNNLKTMAD